VEVKHQKNAADGRRFRSVNERLNGGKRKLIYLPIKN
jgi:hypothetical protein